MNRKIMSLLIISFLLITQIPRAPKVNSRSSEIVGEKVKYKIIREMGGSQVEEYKTYEITSISFFGDRPRINWKSDSEKGTWDVSDFGTPVAYPGEKWEYINNAFYTAVANYKLKLSSLVKKDEKMDYYFEMSFFYFYIFKGVPRWGKIYDFWGKVTDKSGSILARIIVHVEYFGNGIAKKIIYEESYDLNEDRNISIDEIDRTEWYLIDWSVPLLSAASPFLWMVILLLVVVVFVYFARFIIRKYGVIIMREMK